MIICTDFSNGKKHDFKLFKDSNLCIKKDKKVITDTWYVGIKDFHTNSELPKKRSKNKKLTKEDKEYNRNISRERVLNENVIWKVKIFKIISDRYRNRRKRFWLRFNLISGIYNFELNT